MEGFILIFVIECLFQCIKMKILFIILIAQIYKRIVKVYVIICSKTYVYDNLSKLTSYLFYCYPKYINRLEVCYVNFCYRIYVYLHFLK